MANEFKADIEQLRTLVSDLKPTVIAFDSETDLFETGLLDSLSLIQFITSIEQRYRIALNFKDISFGNFRSLNSLLQLLQRSYHL
jgi:acyl carrier protein